MRLNGKKAKPLDNIFLGIYSTGSLGFGNWVGKSRRSRVGGRENS